jgi:hypothetical protein
MALMCIKTLLGEDLIGDVTIRENTVDIDTPLMVMIVPNEKGQYSVGLAPYMIFSQSRMFEFDKKHIILFTEPADELRNQYHSITGKGIVVPNKPKIELLP